MSFAVRSRFVWQLRTRALALGERTLILGIVNVTPDSFSDGGRYSTRDRAVEHGLFLLENGAGILDIGGESTRPGSAAGTAEAISADQEQSRVLPVVEALRRARPDAVLSVDTYRASTARAAIRAGAEIVNDVSGLQWDSAMAGTVAELGCGLILMHTRGLPSEWAGQSALADSDLLPQMTRELHSRKQTAVAAGIAPGRIVLDPGFGFGKRGAENWALLSRFSDLNGLGYPLLAGASRKGFLAHAAVQGSPTQAGTSPQPASARDLATHAAHTAAILAGAHLIRVHDTRGARESADVADAILNASRQQ